ncbi:MAG: DUF3833 family protein [Paracoccaceae bacterium]|nr:DUF3833 family protein [Paracoccaceae bacterium]
MFNFVLGAGLTICLMLLLGRFTGFRAQRASDYAGGPVQFDLRRHLNGPLDCDGVIYGPTGRVSSRFVGRFHASWEGNTGRMTEHFEYDSGTVQDREWHLTLGDDGRIHAEASDLVGPGSGRQSGSAVNLNYKIRLPEEVGGHVLATTDWMYLSQNGAIVNRSQFRKFGIKVGELVATMRPGTPA